MNKLLLNEPPLMILPTLASNIGLNEAIFLQQLHYWLEKSSTYFDDKKWVYKSLEEWQNEFPFWSNSTIKRAISSVKKSKILLITKLSKNKRDRVNYYSIEYKKLDILEPNLTQPTDQNELMRGVNMNHITAQNEPMAKVKMNQLTAQSEPMAKFKMTQCIYNENQRDYTENTQENTQDIFFKKYEKKKKSEKISWEKIQKKEQKKILVEIKKIESPLLPIEQFVNSLIQHGYKYVDFVKAYQAWDLLLLQKSRFKKLSLKATIRDFL